MAKDIQNQLKTNKQLIQKNIDDEYKLVTLADIKIQNYLLDYFGSSSLNGTYQVIAEEKIIKKINNKNATWKLLIDPLDGTNSFKNQNKNWGVMIGACDNKGILRYSWNLISTGKIFCSGSKATLKESFRQKCDKKLINIDAYDYDSVLGKRFKNCFQDIFKIPINQVNITSYPSAIWTGYKLFTGDLDGLLWLSSKNGKKYYPDYDLIFLGALFDKGYNIIIGRMNNKNSLIAIAPTLDDVEQLYKTGLLLQPVNKEIRINKFINTLKITN